MCVAPWVALIISGAGRAGRRHERPEPERVLGLLRGHWGVSELRHVLVALGRRQATRMSTSDRARCRCHPAAKGARRHPRLRDRFCPRIAQPHWSGSPMSRIETTESRDETMSELAKARERVE